jgi:hypothetical protein
MAMLRLLWRLGAVLQRLLSDRSTELAGPAGIS